MKVILLAGGFGTRLGEYTGTIPKPMLEVGGRPLLWHIMQRYARFGHKDFHVALGYKANLIKEYFLNYQMMNADFTVDLKTGSVTPLEQDDADWRVTLINTGLEAATGDRMRKLGPLIGQETCMLTYGDGVADIDVDNLLAFHRRHGRMATVTAVRPEARFGEISMEGDAVRAFKEKPQVGQGWINGGFFVFEPEFFELLQKPGTELESTPLEYVASRGELMAYRHEGFWQCVDTKRDLDLLERLWQRGDRPWLA